MEFDEQFRKELKLGKYTSWASGLSKENLHVLLWMVGEFGLRSDLLIEVLEKYNNKNPYGGHVRAITALKTIHDIVIGMSFNLEQGQARIREAVAQDQGSREVE